MVYRIYLKRLFDIFFSILLIILLAPIFLLIVILIIAEDSMPFFFIQRRIGKNKIIFNLYKFRTMKKSTPHDVPTHLLKKPEQYITKVGKFLRHTSLDELPQIFNILFGQMSFIGPRPALWNQHDLIKERDKYGANDVLPGLTGWAQINGRDEILIHLKAKLDGEYVKNMSFLFDLKCLFGTLYVVFTQKGIKEGGTGGI